jgi:hypothetical protein
MGCAGTPALDGSIRSGRAEGHAQESMAGVDHPNAIAELRVTLVLPLVATTRPYQPRRRRCV